MTAPSTQAESDLRRARLVLLTSHAPFGPQERFVVREAEALARLGFETLLVPVRAGRTCGDPSTELPALAVGLASPRSLAATLRLAVLRPGKALRILRLLLGDRRPRILAKNLAVVPFACRLAEVLPGPGPLHLHATWASTPATVALLVSELTGVPWSFSAHRWDIDEGNLAAVKVRSARFARAISSRGRSELAAAAGHLEGCPKIVCLHLGVPVQDAAAPRPRSQLPFAVAMVGNLVEKKGHEHLIRAAAILRDRGLPLSVRIVGEGPERPRLESLVTDAALDGTISFDGAVPGAEVDGLLRDWADALVQPSVATSSGEYEGIPVALMEAMAAGKPVVATRSGSIEELVTPGTGLLVPPGDAPALADAIESLARDPELAARLAAAGRARVAAAFDENETATELARLIGLESELSCDCAGAGGRD